MQSLNSQTAYDCALGTRRDDSINTTRLETHDTNARWRMLTHETRNTNARPQPLKTGPSTPAKATPVSRATPTTPAKATRVSRKVEEHNRQHHRKAPQTRMKPTTPMRAPTAQNRPVHARKGDAGFMREPTSLPPRTERGTKLSLFDWFSRPDMRIPVDVSRVFHAHRPDTGTATATNLASPIELG